MDVNLPDLIQQMLEPAFYDHIVREPIQLLQTHISYVLLTGDFAYKIKKPVSFGFLDFTTLARRKHYCETELRLNRRLSPQLYLDVVAIGESNGQYQLGGQPAVEYAVKMRQFPQSNLFSKLFEDNRLQASDLVSLAKQVAAFHRGAATSPEIQAYGDLKVVQSIHDNNYQLSHDFIGWTQTQTQYEETKAYSDQFFRDRGTWLQQRREHIKECHGDLHLNNVCRYQGQIQVFDCIEFNQEFRNIDTLYDVAFMVMDLEFQGRSDLASIFLNTYLEETGDYAGVRVLLLYLLMRAYIRGNVSSLALKDPAIAPALRKELEQKAIAYYTLAWTYTQRSQGHLYLMSGLSGSGKSTVARQLTQSLPAIHIRSDALRKHLAGIPLSQTGTAADIYTAAMTQRTYDTLLDLGLSLTQEGWDVILDAKYDRQVARLKAIEAAKQRKLTLKILYCDTDIDVIRERLYQRQGDISDATIDLLDRQISQWQPFLAQEMPYIVPIKPSENLDTLLEDLRVKA